MVYCAIAIAFSNGILSDKNIFFIKKKKKEQNTETCYNIFLLWNILFVLMV